MLCVCGCDPSLSFRDITFTSHHCLPLSLSLSPLAMPPSELKSNGNVKVSCSKPENGFISLPSLYYSENVVQELIQQPSLQGIDEHLLEFSESLRTVAKALRQVSEAKAAAQVEAAEWKRKYELERNRNLQLEQRGSIQVEHHDECNGNSTNNFDNQLVPWHQANESEGCCGKHGICSHEVLRDGETDPEFETIHHRFMKKASFKLSWEGNGDNSNQHKHDIVSFERGNITTAERSSKQISLKWESPPQTVLILTKPNSTSVKILCAEMVRWLQEKKLKMYVEPRVRVELLAESSFFDFVQTWKDDKEISFLHRKVDLVITLGGDGTVLWAASMFKGPIPPVVPFSLGSLGFMTPFHSEHYRDYLDSVLRGPISITLRHRLQCHVIKEAAKNKCSEAVEPILVLNEVTIDRGISSYLTNLECYCDNSFVTLVQGDGLILSSTSGSTAYSLAAGGSMVHPQVPGILFTPICPHSLSFRPLILPEYVTLRVQVPFNSRSHAWVSFDGKDRKQLAPGDALVCSMAPWPVPTACQVDSTSDFMRSIHEGLHWNLRKVQSFDGPRDP